MKIALLGYGRMGRAIENIAKNRGHEIVAKIDKDQIEGTLEHANVAINFSIPDAAVNNIFSALSLKIPVKTASPTAIDNDVMAVNIRSRVRSKKCNCISYF